MALSYDVLEEACGKMLIANIPEMERQLKFCCFENIKFTDEYNDMKPTDKVEFLVDILYPKGENAT